MNANQRKVLAVSLAAIALGGALMQRSPAPDVAPPPPPRETVAPASAAPPPAESVCLIATQDLDPAMASRITTGMVRTERLLRDAALPDPSLLVRSYDWFESHDLVSPVYSGEVVLKSRFVARNSSAGNTTLCRVVPAGFRAVTLSVESTLAAGGFISQGDRIDVVATHSVGSSRLSRTILQDVDVLAVGPVYKTAPDRTRGGRVRATEAGSSMLTLLVTPAIVPRLIQMQTAEGGATFRCVLRNPDDHQIRPSAGRRLSGLQGNDLLVEDDIGAGPAERDAPVEIIRGSAREELLGGRTPAADSAARLKANPLPHRDHPDRL